MRREKMIVTLVRHYKVDYIWKNSYSSEEYREALREYDQARVVAQKTELTRDYDVSIISSLPRTLETLSYLKPDSEYRRTSLIDEVPLAPHNDSAKSRTLGWLYFMARLQWRSNNARQPESWKQTKARANRFIDEFLTEEMNYLVIGHGLFLSVLGRALLNRGFKGKAIVHFRNGEQSTFISIPRAIQRAI